MATKTKKKVPWAGIDYIERRWFDIQPALASVYLDGVGSGPRQVPPEEADEILKKARALLAWLRPQRGPTVGARRWHASMVSQLSSLLKRATAVRRGRLTSRLSRGV